VSPLSLRAEKPPAKPNQELCQSAIILEEITSIQIKSFTTLSDSTTKVCAIVKERPDDKSKRVFKKGILVA
jgi:hypothetical protein